MTPKTSPSSTASSASSTIRPGTPAKPCTTTSNPSQYDEARGDIYGAGLTRYNIALLLQDAGRPGDALHYARAALHDYERTGPGAAQKAADARDLIARLETQVIGTT